MSSDALGVFDGFFDDPSQYVRSFDGRQKTATILNMTRSSYEMSTFLDDRAIHQGGSFSMPLDDLLRLYAANQKEPARKNFIFHTAFCGSTLLSRCLDIPGESLALREPFLLHQLSFDRRRMTEKKFQADRGTILQLSVACLSRTFHDREVALIKPSDSCLSLLADLCQKGTRSSAILLYAELRPFLVSMLKSNPRRDYVREMIPRAEIDLSRLGYSLPDVEVWSDAEGAAAVWLSLIAGFTDRLSDPELNLVSLNSSAFFANPADALLAASEFFEIDVRRGYWRDLINGGILKRNAKNPFEKYDPVKKRHDVERDTLALKSEIELAERWVEGVAPTICKTQTLLRPLI